MSEERISQADPRQITDPIRKQADHHTVRRPYVYFEEMADKIIKIGYVGSLKLGLKNTAHYARTGATLLAVIPGRDIEERELQFEFGPAVRGKEYFAPTARLLEYIDRLLDRKFAAPTYDGAQCLGWLDYQIWRPGSPSLANAELADGQMSLFGTFPVRERIARAAKNFSAMSLTDDWYTPKKWVDLARAVMGEIDLDPASCKQANDECVNARHWYTKEQNGLDVHQKWFGRIWLNPPYGSGPNSQKMFLRRLRAEVHEGTVQQAVTCLSLNTMSTRWFSDSIAPIAAAHCIPAGRVDFVPPAGGSRSMAAPTHGTVFTYVGPHVDLFAAVYAEYGQVIIPYASNMQAARVAA